MTKRKPWYKVVTPREDLREGRPLDAAEFAVHLDQVREGRGSEDYSKPERFFDRTFLTKNLLEVSAQVARRLSGEKTATSAVFNMATQFGGGKTHTLTLLYHLASLGPKATKLAGVPQILEKAGVGACPAAKTAVFVGTEFDSIQGRGGDDGTPLRRTPWGEIAFQLAGEEGFREVAGHEEAMIAPAGDVIRKFLPKDEPCLILMDELMNYISRNRKGGLSSQLYNFLQSLSEESRASDHVVLVASVPASELEMTAEDQSDYERFKKMLDRLGKAVIMSAEAETSEIIRRRLFEWDTRAISASGKVMVPREGVETCKQEAEWVQQHRQQIPTWFPIDHAQSEFESTYPFHPSVLSVFERKWQELPRFQQTRGVLRLLALWVAKAYEQGFKGAHKDPLITLGTAPLDDALFRSAAFEQLGESKLEGAVTTDIAGKKDSHAIRLDQEAVDTIRENRVHRKVATSILFESNGGQTRRSEATVPEIRLGVAGPDIDVGNIDTVLEALSEGCYYLTSEQNCYYFSLKENLNKRYADRRASVDDATIDARVREEVQKQFPNLPGVDRRFFPEKSAQVSDVPGITLVVWAPEDALQGDPSVPSRIEAMTREYGKSARTYKSALIWVVPETSALLRDEARKLLAWESIQGEGLKLDEAQDRQLDASVKKSRRDLTEAVWRSYKHLYLLGRDNKLQTIDLGLVTSSAADSIPKHILNRLRQTGEVEKEVSPRFLVRNWPPAFTEWSTKGVRDAFYASPQFPRLLEADSVCETVARGAREGLLAYVGKSPKGGYDPFVYKQPIERGDIEVSEDLYVITAEEAEKHIEPPRLEKLLLVPARAQMKPLDSASFTVEALDQHGERIDPGEVEWAATGGTIDSLGSFEAGAEVGRFEITAKAGEKTATAMAMVFDDADDIPPAEESECETATQIAWTGEVPPQKWSQLYMKVLSKLVSNGSVSIRVAIEASPKDGVTDQRVEETKAALRGLGLNDAVTRK